MDNNNNDFNINNPFLALDNNQGGNQNGMINNEGIPNNNSNDIVPSVPSGIINDEVSTLPKENFDEVLGINQFNANTNEKVPNDTELDSILGLNNQNSSSNIPPETPNKEKSEEEKLDNILGLNGSNKPIEVPVENQNNTTNKKANNNYIKIAALVLVVVVIVGVVMLFTSGGTSNNNPIDEAKKKAFKSTAVSFIDVAEKKVYNNTIIDCVDATSKNIELKELIDDADVTDNKSIFGNQYDLDNSYVKVEADEQCNNMSYYIYITDGKYSIGKKDEPVAEDTFSDEKYDIQ